MKQMGVPLNIGTCPMITLGDTYNPTYEATGYVYNKQLGGTCLAYRHLALIVLQEVDRTKDFYIHRGVENYVHPGRLTKCCDCPLQVPSEHGPVFETAILGSGVGDANLPLIELGPMSSLITSEGLIIRLAELAEILKHREPIKPPTNRYELLDLE